MKIKLVASLVFLFLVHNVINAANCTAITSGVWENPTIWSCGRVPLCTDNVTIPSGYTVTVTSQIDYSTGGACSTQTMVLTVNGRLIFQSGKKLILPTASRMNVGSGGVIDAQGGGGSSNLITIGTVNVWTAGIGDVTGPFGLNSGCKITSASPTIMFNPPGCGLVVLPIQLIDFSAKCNSNEIILNWSTASEKNNNYFLLESSKDVLNWQEIAKIKGAENSSTKNNYVHHDAIDNNNELTYYRLSQVDIDGTKEMFKTIDVNCKSDNSSEFIIYPNPAYNELNVVVNTKQVSAKGILILYDNLGGIILNTKLDLVSGLNKFNLPIDAGDGLYSVQFKAEGLDIPAQKLVILNP